MDLPQRKHLPHALPTWLNPNSEVFFLTFCCRPRGQNQLADPINAPAIFETVSFRNEKHIWFAFLFLLMPDHAHALISFPPATKTITEILAGWKEWSAKQIGIQWQRDFFEHRLRREESWREKAQYILENPVRAKLVPEAQDWPYVWSGQGFPSL
jgi:putative transposase